MQFDPSTPYGSALYWIQRNPGTGGALRLAKLIMSLWNDDCCFSVGECLSGLDAERKQVVLDCVDHYAQFGEDEELRSIGRAVYEEYPRLWDLGQAATEAKRAMRAEWERQRMKELEEEESSNG